MSEPTSEELEEIVDLSTCSKKKPVIVGAVVTCVLSFVPVIPLLNVIIGAVLAVGMFTKTYGITIRKRVGALIGAMSVALGSVLFFPMSGGVHLMVQMTDPEAAKELKESQVEALYEQGNVGMAQFLEKGFPDQIEPSELAFALVLMFVFVLVFSASFGALFGAIGAALFKKGPLAL